MTSFLESLEMLESLELWLQGTALSSFVTGNQYLWQAMESLHFLGLSLLIGTVGLFDLRLLGFAKNLQPSTLHQLVPIGVLGFGINLITGTLFFVGTPADFIYNAAFAFKMLFMLLSGINLLVFYLVAYRDVEGVKAGEHAPMRARLIGGISLILWLGIITYGRLLTFYKPF